MLPELGRIGPIIIRTYTLLLDAAILFGLASLAWRGRRTERRAAAWVDTGLAALAAGIVGGRLGHVALHWGYFIESPAEIVRIWRGGLDWHAATLVGLGGLALGSRLRRVSFQALLGALVYVLPVGFTLAAGGCLMSACAYGKEVFTLAEHSTLLVAELPDRFGTVLPRYSSQGIGIAMGLILILAVWGLGQVIRGENVRFWLLLGFTGLAAFGQGFSRGDPAMMVGPLRLDQAFDLITATIGMVSALLAARRSMLAAEPQTAATGK